MIAYPNIDPIAFSLGPLDIRWYGIMYLLAFLMAYGVALWRIKHLRLDWTEDTVSDLIFYAALGVILGGRIGYILFYNFNAFLHDPILLFKIREGGMSFHGGLLGVIIALALFARKTKRAFLDILDFTAPMVPLGIAAGRAGNFINAELWGRVTNMPWGMVFPTADAYPRHPSQLYELCLEGLLLFVLVFWYANQPRPKGRVSAVFLIGYACARILAECFRAPDVQTGFLAFDWLTEGQLLSIPMLLIGGLLWWRKYE